MKRRTLTIAACLLLAGLASPAAAQQYPTQTIRIISSFGAGGGSDIIARILAQRMQEKLGQNVVVENKPGAGGVLGNEVVANSAEGRLHARRPDGRPDHRVDHQQEHALRPSGRVRLDRPDRDRRPVHGRAAGLRRTRTSSRWSRQPRPNPGKITFGSPGFAATQHLAGELFKQRAGIDMLHVPYKTTPEVMAALHSQERRRA